MNYRYVLIEAKIEQRIYFGIAAVEADCDTQKKRAILKSYIDLSSNRQDVISFVEICNRLQLSPLHLHDAVSDFIATL